MPSRPTWSRAVSTPRGSIRKARANRCPLPPTPAPKAAPGTAASSSKWSVRAPRSLDRVSVARQAARHSWWRAARNRRRGALGAVAATDVGDWHSLPVPDFSAADEERGQAASASPHRVFTRTSKRPGTAPFSRPRSRRHHETHRARSRAPPCRIFACSATAPARPENRAGGRRYGWYWSGIHAGHQNSCCTVWESRNFRQCGRTPAVLFAHRRNGRIKNDDPGARPPPAVRRRGKREWTAQGVAALLSTNSFFPRFDRDSRWCDVQMRARHQLTQHSQSRCLAPTRPIISCKGNVLWLLNQPECDRQRNICKNTESFTHGRRDHVLTACYILLPRRTK